MADSRRRQIQAAIPLVATLCMIAGAVDVIAYILFGKIFIANMTGNTVLFAASVVVGDWSQAALRIGVVVTFLAGIFIAETVLRRLTAGRERQRETIYAGHRVGCSELAGGDATSRHATYRAAAGVGLRNGDAEQRISADWPDQAEHCIYHWRSGKSRRSHCGSRRDHEESGRSQENGGLLHHLDCLWRGSSDRRIWSA